jgi:hypothetical protein
MSFIQKGLLGLAIIAALVGFGALAGWHYGVSQVQAAWDKAKQRQERVVITTQLRDAVASVEVVTKYVDKIKVVREQGQTIIKQVPIYVTQQDDDRGVINVGFVRLWNAANTGNPPSAAGAADAQASSVRLSDVAIQHGLEASQCRAVEEQLIGLQEWVKLVAGGGDG